MKGSRIFTTACAAACLAVMGFSGPAGAADEVVVVAGVAFDELLHAASARLAALTTTTERTSRLRRLIEELLLGHAAKTRRLLAATYRTTARPCTLLTAAWRNGCDSVTIPSGAR